MTQIFGLHLSHPTKRMMSYIWSAVKDQGGSGNGRAMIPLKEHLFQLFVMFWTELSKDGDIGKGALVHFTGVLGIHL
ncbi:hypothetical protein B0J14DRAFT_350077 [Halenospora varia]|nr:hypothetical protein B0J14DRAFT_350077 [Halenospora varia]